MRIATRQRGDRIEYRERTERDLTAEVPTQPAAVLLFDRQGYCTTLCLDFDAHDRTPEQASDVSYELFQAEALLDQAGAIYVVDRAHCGAHLYVLLETPMRFLEARELVEAMTRRWATLDPGPHQSAASGCITVPGSAHRLGGQREITSSPQTLAAVAAGARTSAAAIARLRLWLHDELAATRAHRAGELLDEEPAFTVREPGAGRVMATRFQDLAVDGDYASRGYRSASEARAAVLMSAAIAGLSREDVFARMSDGRWAGLWDLHSHKSKPRQVFVSEWTRAEAKVRATSPLREKPARTSDTSAKNHRGESAHGAIRAWRSTLHHVETIEFPGAAGWTRRLLLRAIAKQSHEVGSTLTASGIRSLSLATGLSLETIASLLRELSAAPDPWIQRVARAAGRNAASYVLRLPARHQDTVESVRWVRGKAHAIRPVFERLGAPAALVYEAIEHLDTPSTARIQLRTGLSRNTVRDALSCLEGWHLIAAADGNWTLTSTDADLERLAERFGIVRARATRIQQFREHRRVWWAYLARHEVLTERDLPEETSEVIEMIDQMRLDELDPSPPLDPPQLAA